MIKRLLIFVLISTTLLGVLPNCGSPAEFKAITLDIKPSEVIAGNPVDINVTIKNSGGSEGTYSAILNVDGTNIETKDVALKSGATQEVVFILTKDKPGTYSIAVDNLKASLTVKPKPKLEEVELKYDDGIARDLISAVPPLCTGYAVDFTPPSVPFSINKVRIYGGIYGTFPEGREFEVQILDESLKSVYKASYSINKFPINPDTKNAAWVELELPAVKVDGKFYVFVYTDTGMNQGVHIGADDSVVNTHSAVTVRDGVTDKGVFPWPYWRSVWFGDPSKVNWMIRVVGSYLASE